MDRFETGPIAEIAISKLVSEEADDTVACVMGSRVPASLTNSFGSHLADRSWIAGELCVGGQKRDSFDESLREQKAIKRIGASPLDSEEGRDLALTHLVEISRHGDLAS